MAQTSKEGVIATDFTQLKEVQQKHIIVKYAKQV